MKLKYLISIIFFIGTFFITNAQDSTEIKTPKLKRNFLSLESSFYLHFNPICYERLILDSKYHHLMLKIGVAFNSGTITDIFKYSSVKVPLGITYLFGKKNHFAELGAGVIYSYDSYWPQRNVFTPYGLLGYRYEFSNIPVFLGLKSYVLSNNIVVLLGFKF
jgi:hypothetical protein